MEYCSLIVCRWITTSFVHLLGRSSHSPGGEFTLPELVCFVWYHNCAWKSCTVLHKQISKRFLPLLETEEDSHLPSLPLPFPPRAHFCLSTRFSLFGLPKATFPSEQAEKQPQRTCRREDREREGRHLLYGEELSPQYGLGPGMSLPNTTGPAARPQQWAQEAGP